MNNNNEVDILRSLMKKENIGIDVASVILTISEDDNMRTKGREKVLFQVGVDWFVRNNKFTIFCEQGEE